MANRVPLVGGFVFTARWPLSTALTNEWLASHAIVRQAFSQWEGPGGHVLASWLTAVTDPENRPAVTSGGQAWAVGVWRREN